MSSYHSWMALCCTTSVLFWNKVGCLSFVLCSTKLTKLWSTIKKQKEDDYHYGGERKSQQVIANSLVPTIICLYITLARLHLIQIPASFSGKYVFLFLFISLICCCFPQCCLTTVNAVPTPGEVRWELFPPLHTFFFSPGNQFPRVQMGELVFWV